MSPDELNITVETEEIQVVVDSEIPNVEIVVDSFPDVVILGSGNMGPVGPPGPQGQWVGLTQAEYDALDPPDPETLYVIIG